MNLKRIETKAVCKIAKIKDAIEVTKSQYQEEAEKLIGTKLKWKESEYCHKSGNDILKGRLAIVKKVRVLRSGHIEVKVDSCSLKYGEKHIIKPFRSYMACWLPLKYFSTVRK